jgi:hypothetical protein
MHVILPKYDLQSNNVRVSTQLNQWFLHKGEDSYLYIINSLAYNYVYVLQPNSKNILYLSIFTVLNVSRLTLVVMNDNFG